MMVESSSNVAISEADVGLFILSDDNEGKTNLYNAFRLHIGNDSVLLFTLESDLSAGRLSLCDNFDLYSKIDMQRKLKKISEKSLVLLDLKDKSKLHINEDGVASIFCNENGINISLHKN